MSQRVVQGLVSTITRGAQVLFGILTLALASAAVSGTNKHGFYYDVDALAIAVSIFTLIYAPIAWLGVLATDRSPLESWMALGAELVLNLLWFATFIALAAIHGPTHCRAGNPDWCACGKAAAAMAAMCWAFFMVPSVLAFRNFKR